eukprot:353880-Chlamydomonas_euryale.AAC.2
MEAHAHAHADVHGGPGSAIGTASLPKLDALLDAAVLALALATGAAGVVAFRTRSRLSAFQEARTVGLKGFRVGMYGVLAAVQAPALGPLLRPHAWPPSVADMDQAACLLTWLLMLRETGGAAGRSPTGHPTVHDPIHRRVCVSAQEAASCQAIWRGRKQQGLKTEGRSASLASTCCNVHDSMLAHAPMGTYRHAWMHVCMYAHPCACMGTCKHACRYIHTVRGHGQAWTHPCMRRRNGNAYAYMRMHGHA